MPELPEVETVKRGLAPLLMGAKVERVWVSQAPLRIPWPAANRRPLLGAEVLSVQRRAKYLLIETSRGHLLNHLGMTGSWRLAPEGEERLHDHCYLELSDGRRLAYNDPRRFGLLTFVPSGKLSECQWLKFLGPEPLDESVFHADYLFQKSRGRKQPVKSFLMDQKVVVGVGNIYASEALFRAGIRPLRMAMRLTKEDTRRLISAIFSVLNEAIHAQGTTLRDYRQADGSTGGFQNTLRVYGREGSPCWVCESEVKGKRVAGRSTFWCPQCQK